MSEAPYILHTWPSKWNLKSLDPTCLAAVMYLQLTIPGKFRVAESTNPDESSNGQLPFMTHEHLVFSSLPAIISFVTSLSKSSRTSGATDIDASLTTFQKAQRTAWYAHIEANIGDLVSHMLYGIDANFRGLTQPALANEMPLPQKYYVPGRIRETYKPRLEASGLWSLPGAEQEKKNPFTKEEKKEEDHKGTFARVFEREKVLEKARTTLGAHARLLEGKQFFFGDRPTSIDLYLASHILLLADPPFPDSVLQALLLESYPVLIDHARRVQAEVARAPPYEHLMGSTASLIPRSFNWGTNETNAPDADDIRFRRMRLIWVAMVAAIAMCHVALFTSTLAAMEEQGEEEEEEEGKGRGDVVGESEGEGEDHDT
ncbi:hypothetical protein PAXRUDRAFT_823574 [Paxillus rubicundulus Ve08.2h10]|uniref:Mitochondrial outer membrane transport complex Sam37/metaxin N-terminal domain-containing protein n=1 Tax=Paxillus rubicundulus Ve08.2h10 TaxID=930991 RepID=A0A0D0DJS3_9AGAM|nr:hypothetical protein PAXRUDRAFT_823574 [Paxillus rubicundulus Ve08.2h10]